MVVPFESRFSLLNNFVRVVLDQILYYNKAVPEFLFVDRFFYHIRIKALEVQEFSQQYNPVIKRIVLDLIKSVSL